MIFTHHELRIELNDNWWSEAGMIGFVPMAKYYRVDPDFSKGQQISAVRIEDVEAAVVRSSNVGIFHDSIEEGTARERVLRILRGFRLGEAIPPVQISAGRGAHRFKLVHGAHRFYCSLAAGFTHVPAIKGFDYDSLDQ
jgi:hypothetical protein